MGGLICPKCKHSRNLPCHNMQIEELQMLSITQRRSEPKTETLANPDISNKPYYPVLGEMMQIWLDAPQNARPIAIQMAEMALNG
jgi:hypothetical protein